jgi:hypothetical protein
MPYPLPPIRNIGIHAFSVVSDSQSKQIAAVRDLSFDSAAWRAAHPQRPHAIRKISMWTFDSFALFLQSPLELCRILISVLRDKFFKRCDFSTSPLA